MLHESYVLARLGPIPAGFCGKIQQINRNGFPWFDMVRRKILYVIIYSEYISTSLRDIQSWLAFEVEPHSGYLQSQVLATYL